MMIEVTGSANKASSALDKVISKLLTLQQTFDKVTPALDKFTAKMDSIAKSSKAIVTLKSLTDNVNKNTLAAANAESKMAMYQARLDRANVSMERSRVSSLKLVEAQKKLKEASNFDIANKQFLDNFKFKGYPNIPKSVKNCSTPVSNVPSMDYNTQKIQQEIDNFASKVSNKKEPLKVDTTQAVESIKKVQAYIDSIRPSISRMSQEAQVEFNKLSTELIRVTNQINNQNLQYRKLAQAATQAARAHGEGSSQYLKAEKQMLTLDGQTDKLIATQDKLKSQMSNFNVAGVDKYTTATKRATKQTNLFGREASKASRRAVSGFQKTLIMMKNMFIRIIAFRLFSMLSKSITDGMNNIAQASDNANKSISAMHTSTLYLKNSLASAFMPVVQALTPIITQLVDALAGFFNMVAMLNARIFGGATSVTIAKRASVDYAASIAKTGSSAKNTRKEIKELQRSIMGFDELNILSKQSSASPNGTGVGSGTPGMPNPQNMFKTVKIPAKILAFADKIKKSLADITAVVSGALLAVGAILLLTGANVPLGLGLMAIGAIGLAEEITANWDCMKTPLLNVLTAITSMLGGFLLTLGAILAFSGANIPLGIGLMVVGAASLATAVALNWGNVKTDISTVLSGITGIVSGATLALGALFTLTGVDVPLGIGLMLVGAVGIASTVALNWDTMSNETKESLSTISAIVSGSMLALGAILTLTGAAPALGIPMMIVGASTLASAIALNWDSMSNKLKSTLTAITTIVGSFCLALGAILVFSGAGLPLGIALIATGAASLATAAALNWDTIKNKIKTVLADITAVVSTALVAVGIILCLTGAGIPLGIGMIAAGAAGLFTAPQISSTPITNHIKDMMNGIIGIVENGVNFCIEKLNTLSWTVPGWVPLIGGNKWGFDINKVHIPRLASGGLVTAPTYSLVGEGKDNEAVIPLNNQVFSSIGKGIADNSTGGSADTERLIDRLDRLEAAIKGMRVDVSLIADDREIAKSSNRGNARINRRFHPIAST